MILPIQFINNCNKHNNKPVLHTQAVHGEDTKKTQETALQYRVQIPSRDGEIKGQI